MNLAYGQPIPVKYGDPKVSGALVWYAEFERVRIPEPVGIGGCGRLTVVYRGKLRRAK